MRRLFALLPILVSTVVACDSGETSSLDAETLDATAAADGGGEDAASAGVGAA